MSIGVGCILVWLSGTCFINERDGNTKISFFDRMALELGLNKDVDFKDNGKRTMSVDRWIEIEVQRRVFWAVFTLDK